MSTTTTTANDAAKAIFSPIKVGSNSLKHRVVLSPCTRLRAVNSVPTDLYAKYFQQRASPGGLLIAESTYVTALAGGSEFAPGIYSQEQIEGWKKSTSVVHEKQGTIFLQLMHAGRTSTKLRNPNQEQIVSASAIPMNGNNTSGGDAEVPHALEIEEIKTIVQDYKQAALNAIEAGFDGVEIQGANGYLIDQFTNSSTNKRTDIYGGSIANRARFALEVIDAIVDAIGAERTAIRFSPGGVFNNMGDDTVVETWSYLVKAIQDKYPHFAYMHMLETQINTFDQTISGPFVDSLEPYRQIWKGPFILSGFSGNVEHALAMADKTGALIAFGRVFIANPDLPERIRNGWPLNKYDRDTFYSHGIEGFVDYPTYNDAKNN